MVQGKKLLATLQITFLLGIISCSVGKEVYAEVIEEKRELLYESVQMEDYDNYSEQYKEYLKLSDEEKSKIGVVPRKYNIPMPESMITTENNMFKKAMAKLGQATLPSSYVLTGEDTNNDGIVNSDDVKANQYGNIKLDIEDQGDYEDCWAFASMNSLETNLELNGYGHYNFSELHLDYLDYLDYDKTLLKRTLHSAGNFEGFEQYVKRNKGPVLETEVPYNATYDTIEEIEELMSYKQRARANNFVYMPTIDKTKNEYYAKNYYNGGQYHEEPLTEEILINFRNNVKNHIIKNGSLCASVYSGDVKLSNKVNKNVVNTTNRRYGDHSISIIGWDDNFSKDNFPEECRPENDGAYIALNTWKGESESYILYISYEDCIVEFDMDGVEDAYLTEPFYISVEASPNKVNYIEGEKFNTQGLEIKATYQNGTQKAITNYSIEDKELSSEDKYVTISYTEGKTTQTIKQEINVYTTNVKIGENIYAYYNSDTKLLDIVRNRRNV